MLKKISFGLLGLGLIVSAPMYSMVHQMTTMMSLDLKLEPNVPENFSNIFLWGINAVCTVESTDENDLLHIRMVKGSGELNGQKLEKNDEMEVLVHNGDLLSITANKSSSVDITNKGEHVVIGHCHS